MSKMRKFKYLWLILLVLILSACGVFGSKTFNEDGSEASPFSFEYPSNWEVLYTEQQTLVFQDASEIEFDDDGSPTTVSVDAVGFDFRILTPEFMNERYGTTEITPLEMLQQYEQQINEWLEETENREVIEESDELTGFLQQQTPILSNVIDSPTTYQICGKDVVGMKLGLNMPPLVIGAHFSEVWLFYTVIDDQPIEVTGYANIDNEERFEEIFESIICSLEVHESE